MTVKLKNQINKQKKTKEGRGVLNRIINNLPFEAHLPGYNYCGPGTKLKQRLDRGDKGINQLDEACKEHDIAYSQNKNIVDRHSADKILAEKAWARVKAKDSGFGERASSWLVTNAMKTKIKTGMGCFKKGVKKTLNKVIQEAKLAIKGCNSENQKSVIKKALKTVKKLNKNRKLIKVPRVIPVPKTGGIIPLIPIFAGLSAAGALAGGAAGISKAINEAKNAKKLLHESERHNKTMEAIALRGNGLHLKPYKQGLGLYIKPKNW